MKTKIIVTDDHQLFAEGIVNILAQEKKFEILPCANGGEDLLRRLKTNTADLILLDVSMPGMDGIETARRLFLEYPNVLILMVTMNDQPDILRTLIQIGVHGIILKNTGKAELLLAIDELLKENTYFSPKITRQLASDYKSTSTDAWQLSKREKEVLLLIYEGLTTNEIADKLRISIYTVETHKKSLFQKSGLNKSSQLVRKAQDLGYLK